MNSFIFQIEEVTELGSIVDHLYLRCAFCLGRLEDFIITYVKCRDCHSTFPRPDMLGTSQGCGVRVTLTKNEDRARLWIASWLGVDPDEVGIEVSCTF